LPLKIAVLMGGMSAEREVSLNTGMAIAEALRRLGHSVVEVDVGRDLPRVLSTENPDVAFTALHGRGGEDGSVQGLLEIMRIPYTGSGILASAVTMDKVMTKKLLRFHGIPVIDDVLVRKGGSYEDAADSVLRELSYPVMVKPAMEGSSIAVTMVGQPAGLKDALDTVFEIDERALVENFIEGRLLTVGILGREPKVLPVLEIKTREGFYDYRAKYQPGFTEYEVPAVLSEDIARSAQDLSRRTFEYLECEGVSRVDLILEKGAERLFVLEINTVPGMTATSLIPKAANAAGITFEEVVALILEEARLKIDLEGQDGAEKAQTPS
jgi:D-alanine-D-alanine ligase